MSRKFFRKTFHASVLKNLGKYAVRCILWAAFVYPKNIDRYTNIYQNFAFFSNIHLGIDKEIWGIGGKEHDMRIYVESF